MEISEFEQLLSKEINAGRAFFLFHVIDFNPRSET
jgi:hypothetical protein